MTILLSILTYVLYERSSDMVFEKITENAGSTLLQVSQNLDHKLASYEKIANSLYVNMTLQEKLLMDYEGPRAAYDVYFEHLKPFISMMRTAQDIHRLTIYTPNPSFVFSSVVYLDEQTKQTRWYQKLNRSYSGSYWSSIEHHGIAGVEIYASLKQKLNYYKQDTELLVALDIELDELYKLVNEESRGKQIIITWPDEKVLLDTRQRIQEPSRTMKEYPFYEELPALDAGYVEYENESGKQLLLFNTLHSRNVIDGMKVLMVIPMQEILPEMQKMRNLLLVLLLIACAISAVLIYAFTFGMMRKLSELSKKMMNVRQDHFRSYIEVRGNDEISELGKIFNRMVRELDRLIHEVYQGELDRKSLELRTMEAELYALQTQVNPHFLYNVLNTLRGNLLEHGDTDNAEIVSLIAKAFRIILKKSEMKVRLKEEVELVQIYLQIQQYRFGERLNYSLDIPSELEQLKVPKMSLQPLVENVIAHVLEIRGKPTHIDIRAAIHDEHVYISVADNGPGIDSKRLKEIKGWLKNEHVLKQNQHLGLKNVHFRLISMYGKTSGLRFDCHKEGTKVSMVIPLERKGGEILAASDDRG